MEKYLDITKPCYSEQILPVPWYIVISRFHSTIHYWRFLIFTDHSSNAHLKGFWKEAPSYSWSYVKFSFHFADKKTRNFLVKLFFKHPVISWILSFLIAGLLRGIIPPRVLSSYSNPTYPSEISLLNLIVNLTRDWFFSGFYECSWDIRAIKSYLY